MNIPNRRLRTASLFALTVGLLAPGAAFAMQDEGKPGTPPATERPQRDRSRGGDVQNPPRTPPEGVQRGEGRGQGRGEGRPGDPNRPAGRPAGGPPWLPILQQLDLSDAQKALIEPMIEEFRKSEQKFREEVMPKVQELQQAQRERMRSGEATERDPEIARQTQELMAKRPKAEDLQKKVMAQLTPDQQAAFKAKMEEMEKRMRERREARRGEGAGEGTEGRPSGRPGTGDAPTRGRGGDAPQRGRQGGGQGGQGTDPTRDGAPQR